VRIVHSRVSAATQSLLRQRHILTEAGLLVRTEGVAEGFRPAEGMLLFEDPATTSKIPALERPAFAKVAAAAYPGDVLTVSELFRLCRDLVDIHAVRDWCTARGVALRVLSGPLSKAEGRYRGRPPALEGARLHVARTGARPCRHGHLRRGCRGRAAMPSFGRPEENSNSTSVDRFPGRRAG